MTRRVALIGASAIPVGRHQTTDDAALQVLEHEIMARLVVDAVQDAGVAKEDCSVLSFFGIACVGIWIKNPSVKEGFRLRYSHLSTA